MYRVRLSLVNRSSSLRTRSLLRFFETTLGSVCDVIFENFEFFIKRRLSDCMRFSVLEVFFEHFAHKSAHLL